MEIALLLGPRTCTDILSLLEVVRFAALAYIISADFQTHACLSQLTMKAEDARSVMVPRLSLLESMTCRHCCSETVRPARQAEQGDAPKCQVFAVHR